jgi:hypothetical protein
MSLIRKSTDSLSGNDKVRHYLQNSTNNSLKMLDNSSSNHLFSLEEYRLCSSLESDSPSHSDLSTESSLSDPIVYSNTIRSNLSSDEDLDFNIGFAQMIDEEEILHKNNEFILAEYFRQSSNSTIFNDDYETITTDYTKPHAHFLHDSTYTLCSAERYSAYTEDNQGNEGRTGLAIRSNSLNVLQLDDNSTFVETTPKKVVRFADMLVGDEDSLNIEQSCRDWTDRLPLSENGLRGNYPPLELILVPQGGLGQTRKNLKGFIPMRLWSLVTVVLLKFLFGILPTDSSNDS